MARPAASIESLPQKIAVRNLDFYYGDHRALKSINTSLYQGKVTAFIGPSGCGKSTLLRVLNRMYDLYPNQRAEGRGAAGRGGYPLPVAGFEPAARQGRHGVPEPTPFPMTIFENIAFGIRLYERLPKAELEDRVQRALQRAALWNEVKDKLNASGLPGNGHCCCRLRLSTCWLVVAFGIYGRDSLRNGHRRHGYRKRGNYEPAGAVGDSGSLVRWRVFRKQAFHREFSISPTRSSGSVIGAYLVDHPDVK